MAFASIPEILEELRAGRMIVLVDDEDRENEGDLVIAAEKVTPEAINFMAMYGRGLICLALTPERIEQLDLPLMAPRGNALRDTAFTVSVDARHGVSTGISSHDRAHTIRVAIDERTRPDDLVRPGHVFPLRAREGGVLVRAGHTEGAVDLARLAGLKPYAVICEIMKDDGTMARLPDLEAFCQRHGLKMCTVADIIKYRLRHERLVRREVSVDLPTQHGDFRVHLYTSLIDQKQHVALCRGDVGKIPPPPELARRPVLVRMHSECLTGDVFGSLLCDCGPQLARALELINEAGEGVVVYLRQEGRGIGLENKLHAYKLQQEEHLDTVEANLRLGLPADKREYGIGAQILLDLGLARLRVLTNNPKKLAGLAGYGLEIVEQVPILIPPNPRNIRYLRTKRDKLGHLLDGLPLDEEPERLPGTQGPRG